ncbi:armadillo-type protein [Cunninghamella echinulata]|nr:armadillo-type protein [Cunninghamella echinulata]
MADLGFDFTDDQDEYQNFDDELTEETKEYEYQQYQVNDSSKLLNSQANETSNSSTLKDTTSNMEHESMEDEGQNNNNFYSNEPEVYDNNAPIISPDRLLEPPPVDGLTTDSLLQAMLTEEANEEDLENSLLMDEALSPIERVYKYSKSNIMIHRHLIAKELPIALYDVEIDEAIDDLLPLMLNVAYDEDESVRETFVSELDKMILYFYQNAPPLLEKSTISNTSGQTNENKNSTNEEQTEKKSATDSTMDVDTTITTAIDQSDENKKSLESSDTDNNKNNVQQKEVVESSQQIHTGISHDYTRHIPAKKFAPLLISLLLDQNSNLASLGQQCIVSVAAELASTPQESKRGELDQYLLDTEIFDGIVMGLIDIVEGKLQHRIPNIDENDNDTLNNGGESDDMKQQEDHLSADLSATNINEASSLSSTSTVGVIRRLSTAPGFETSYSNQPSNDDIDQGEINLAKMMCLSLISALTTVLGPQRSTERCLPIVEQLSEDQMFYVRKEAATAIGSLATIVDPKVAMDRLLPLYLTFSRDTIWHVRRSCVLTLPLLCAVLPDDVKTRIATEGVEIFKNDVSRNVRNTLAEIIGELIAKFLPDNWEETGAPGKVPDSLLEFFLSLGASSNANQMFKLETDRAIICAYNFPAVVLTVGGDFWDSHLKETYLSLTKDYQIKVRRTFAYSLHEIARIIGPERTERDLVQIFALYLMDLDDVKQGVLEHLAEFLGTLAVSSRNEYIPILTEVWDGVMTNWRLRDILAAQLREIVLLFDAARVVEHVLPLAIRACKDEFAAVRDTGVEAFPVILDIVKRAVDEEGETLSQDGGAEDEEEIKENKRNLALALLNHVMEKLDEFVRSDKYRSRLVFTQICCSLLDAGISASDFASFFLPRISPLAFDPVVNVRIGASRTIRQIYLNESYHQELCELTMEHEEDNKQYNPYSLDQILYRLALDKDSDVRAYVSDLVDNDRLVEQEKILASMDIHKQLHDQQSDIDEQDEGEEDEDGIEGQVDQDHNNNDSEQTQARNDDIHEPNIPLSSMQQSNTNSNNSSSNNDSHLTETNNSGNKNSNSNVNNINIIHESESTSGHQIMRKLLSDEMNTTSNDSDETIITETQENEADSLKKQMNGAEEKEEEENIIEMDYTDDHHHENKKLHDEDGDAMMTDADHPDVDEDEPAMIDDVSESAFTEEKEKDEYVYLSKSTTTTSTTTATASNSTNLTSVTHKSAS